MSWFGESFRKVHILYVSPPWARGRGQRFDAEEYARQLQKARVGAVELYGKDHHGVCYYPCSTGLPYPRDVVGELCQAVQARGIRFVAYFSVGFDAYALGLHPEWRAADAAGVSWRVPPFDWACLSSPYADFALAQVRELVQRYPIDGLWLDIVPFAWDMRQDLWMQPELPAPCYCMNCRVGFETATGRPLPGPAPALEERRAAYDFLLSGVRRFLQECRAILEEYRPGAILTYNGANGPGDPLGLADLVSIEGHAPHHDRQSFIARWARGTGKPFEIMTAGGVPSTRGGWNSFDQKPPALLRVEAAVAAIHGGNATFGQAPYPDGATEAGQYHGFAQAFSPLVPLEEAGLIAPEGVSDVAIVLSTRPAVTPDTWYTQVAGAEAVHRALLDHHAQFDVLPRAADLGRYGLVILADQVVLGDEEVEALRAYVTDGGRLLVIGPAGLIDGQGKRRGTLPLADLLGVADEGEAGWPYSYLLLGEGPLAGDITPVPILITRSPRRTIARGARVLADLVRPETARTDSTTVLWGSPPPDPSVRQPGATLSEVGAGRVLYIPVSLAGNSAERPWDTRGLEDTWLRAVIRNAVDLLLPDRVLSTDAPPGVEIVLNRHGSRLALHLLDTRPVAPEHFDLRPVRANPPGWTVRLDRRRLAPPGAQVGPPTSIRAVDGTPVEWTAEGGHYILRTPPVDLHTTLILDWDLGGREGPGPEE